jgi:membrane protease YdiL (CAAX protease family)
MEDGGASSPGGETSSTTRGKRRDLAELAIAYGLILIVVWTPRPWQRFLWLVAAAAVAIMISISFDGLEAMGLRRANFFRSLWVVGAAILVAAAAILAAASLHTLHLPGTLVLFIKVYWTYALWAGVQQFLMLGFFLPRCLGLLGSRTPAAILAAVLFAVAHLPNPLLTPITLLWGFAACRIFHRYRNLYPMALAHAIVGITIAISVPGPVVHNMRVGLGYLTYAHDHRTTASPQP